MAEIVNLDDLDNDNEGFLFTSLSTKGNTKQTPISVEHYTLQRDLNSAIMASLNSTKNPKNSVVDLSQENHNIDDYDDNPNSDVPVLNFKPRISGKKRFRDSVVIIEKGQSSKSERKKEDIMLMKLAENKQWRRCPKCRIFVERIDGCLYMKCRCGASFCYGCGTEKICAAYCNVCKRT